MSKSIYEEVLEIIDKNIFELPKGFAVLYEIRERIEQAQKQSQKQEKLLELYRYLNENTISYDLSYDEEDEITSKIDEIEKQIRGLENEKEKENDSKRNV